MTPFGVNSCAARHNSCPLDNSRSEAGIHKEGVKKFLNTLFLAAFVYFSLIEASFFIVSKDSTVTFSVPMT